MERFISDLVKEFESGKIDRRKFCETVALAAVVYAAGESAANAAPAEGFEVIAINHLSYKMSRLSRRARLLRVGLRNGSCSRDRQWRTSKAYVRPRAGQRRNVSRRAQRRYRKHIPGVCGPCLLHDSKLERRECEYGFGCARVRTDGASGKFAYQ